MNRKKREVIYASNQIGVHADRPDLEAPVQQAAERPRSFDLVMMASPEVLGTPRTSGTPPPGSARTA